MKRKFFKRERLLIAVLIFAMLAVTACGSKEAETAVITFDSLATDQVSLIALGNSDVPVGQYSQEILEKLGIWEQMQDKISFGSNVKEVLSQVEEGSVDCGMVYATDAATAEGVMVAAKAPEGSLATPVLYPVARLKEAKNKELAAAFLSFLTTEDSAKEFESVGFTFVGTVTTDSSTESSAEDRTENQSSAPGSGTLTVFAAASLTESMTAIAEAFEAMYPNTEVICNFDSSGTLKTQIEAGAEADIFFSAAQKQMNALEEENLIDTDTRQDLLKNEVVLIVPKD